MFGKSKTLKIENGVLIRGWKAEGKVKVPNNVTKIGKNAFSPNKNITSVIIPEGVTSIEALAFMACRSLKSVSLPASLVNIGDGAFFGCESLKSISLPAGLANLGDDVFYGCKSLKEITVDSGNKNFKIYGNVIYSYDGKILYNYLRNEEEYSFEVPEGVEKIGNRAFIFAKFREVTLPESLKSIGEKAFDCCYDLKKINLHDNIEYIGDYAFEDCNWLTDVTIPKAMKGIGGTAFQKCRNIKLSVSPENKYFNMIDGNLYYYSDGSALDENTKNKEFSTYLNKNNHSFTIPDGVTGIGKGAFFDHEEDIHCELETITIPDSVEYISPESFANCKKLKNIILPEKLTSIPDAAFFNCNELKSINIPSGVKKIGKRAFEHSGLEEVIIPDGVEEIEGNAFFDCASLKKVIIPESVTKIGSCAFYYYGVNLGLTVYCRAKTKPAGWSDDWSRAKVVWGYTGD